MKKILMLSASAALMLGMASCSSDNGLEPGQENGGNVTFAIEMPGKVLGTRAFGDGYTAQKLSYAVYEKDTEKLVTTGEATFPADALQTTVSVALANGKNYRIAFFAQWDGSPYTFDAQNKKFTVDYTAMADYNESDHNDVFFKMHETGVVKGALNQTVTLVRPVAQINWGTNDLTEDAVTSVYGVYPETTTAANVDGLTTSVTVKNVFNTYNFWDDSVSGETDAEFQAVGRPSEAFPVNTYDYVSMNYVLVAADQALVEAVLTPYDAAKVAYEPVVVANCPVQANYRTNIYGALLSSKGTFTVVKDPTWGDPDNDYEYVGVATPEALTAAIANGVSKIDLTQDINVSGTLQVKAGETTTINLNGHKLTRDNAETASYFLRAEGEGTVLILEGNGQVGDENNEKTIPVAATNGGKVIINGGTYVGGVNKGGADEALECIYAVGENSMVEIHGGYFKTTACRDKSKIKNVNCPDYGWYYVVNKQNASHVNVAIYGGEFENYNPAWGDDADAQEVPTSFLAPGYKSVKSVDANGNEVYTVEAE